LEFRFNPLVDGVLYEVVPGVEVIEFVAEFLRFVRGGGDECNPMSDGLDLDFPAINLRCSGVGDENLRVIDVDEGTESGGIIDVLDHEFCIIFKDTNSCGGEEWECILSFKIPRM